MTSELTVYTYDNCDTCRRAVKWLDAHGIDFTEKPIRETPPSPAELRSMRTRLGGGTLGTRKLFNTSGVDYRELKISEKLPSLSDGEVIALLASNGNLIKRPFVLGEGRDGVGMVGFDPVIWAAVLRT